MVLAFFSRPVLFLLARPLLLARVFGFLPWPIPIAGAYILLRQELPNLTCLFSVWTFVTVFEPRAPRYFLSLDAKIVANKPFFALRKIPHVFLLQPPFVRLFHLAAVICLFFFEGSGTFDHPCPICLGNALLAMRSCS